MPTIQQSAWKQRSREKQASSLSITIVFTNVGATLEAVKTGAQLAGELGAKIRILVPSVVPYPLDLNRPHVPPFFRLRRFNTFCEKHAIETAIDVRLCLIAQSCIEEALDPHSLVLIGCSKSWCREALRNAVRADCTKLDTMCC